MSAGSIIRSSGLLGHMVAMTLERVVHVPAQRIDVAYVPRVRDPRLGVVDRMTALGPGMFEYFASPPSQAAAKVSARPMVELRRLLYREYEQRTRLDEAQRVRHEEAQRFELETQRLRQEEARRVRQEEARRMQALLVRLLTQRFGSLSEDIVARVHQAEHAQIEAWMGRVLTAQSIDDIFA